MKQHNSLVQYRYNLKSKIHAARYRTLSEFSKKIGIDLGRLSRIINGWEVPDLQTEQSMSSALAISLEELRELLQAG